PELIEAATRTGRRDLAHHKLGELCDVVVEGSDWAAGTEARCRAILAEGSTAENYYRQAIDSFGRTPLRLDLARAHLLYREVLSGGDRRPDAREHLHEAYERFTAAGAEAFAERARSELLASGEKVRRRDLAADCELTSQEQQIAC